MSLFPAHLWSLRRPAATTTVLVAAAVAAAAGAFVAAGPPAQAGQAEATGWVSVASSPAAPAGYTGSIAALAPTGPASAWAAGTNQYTPPGGQLSAINPFVYEWTGGHWVNTPIASPDAWEAIAAVADGGPGDAWTVGDGTNTPSQGESFQPLLRHWDGSAWQLTPFPGDTESVGDVQLTGVAATGGKAWISALDGGDGGILSWGGKSWTLQQISSAEALWGITAISATDAWAVGESNDFTALVLHWDGSTWQDESPPSQDADLQVVAASGSDDVWALGFGGETGVVADRWNGTSWTEYQVPKLTELSSFATLGLTVDKSGEPWIAVYSDRADRTAYTHWNGSAWQLNYGAAHPGVIESYSNAMVTLPGDGAILSAGTTTQFGQLASSYAELNPAPYAGAQFATVPPAATGAGKAAATYPVAPAVRYGAPLSALRVPGPHGAIPGAQSAGASAQAGTSTSTAPAAAAPVSSAATTSAWTPAALPPLAPQSSLNGVAATTGGTAWAVGEQYQGIIAPGDPLVLQLSGGRWTNVPLGVQWRGSLTGVAAVSTTDAWAIGTDINGDPHIVHGSDGTWTDVPFPGSGNTSVTLSEIAAAPGANPWVIGNSPDGPVLLRWTSSQWVSQATPAGDTGLIAVTVYSATDVWVAGQVPNPESYYQRLLALSHWNGSTWTTVDTTGTAGWFATSIVAASPDDVWIAGESYPDSPIYDVPVPLLAHWDGTAWTAKSVPVQYATVPSLTAAPDGQPAWASVDPYGSGVAGNPPSQGEAVYLAWNGSAWTLSYGPTTTRVQSNPEMYLAAVPGTTRTIAAGTAPYLNNTHEPLIETSSST